MLEITTHYKTKIGKLLDDDAPFYPEDVLLLYELTDRNFHLKKPCFKEALQFAMEENPKWAYCYNGNQLPFGCHAWCHKDYYPFGVPLLNTDSYIERKHYMSVSFSFLFCSDQ